MNYSFIKKSSVVISVAIASVLGAYASEVSGTISTGLGNSSVSAVVITTPSASPSTGTYTGTQSVTLTAQGATTIRYTIDGNTPTCSTGTLYTTLVSIISTATLKAISCYPNSASSSVATYSYTITSAGGGGGGGGGGGSSFTPVTNTTPTTPVTNQNTPVTGTPKVSATPAKGQVLGATTANFAVDLRMGVRGKDVLELQKLLISQGFLKISTPTNYFGPATRNALIAFQKKNNIVPASGVFGPLTRTFVNKQRSTQ